MLRIDDVTIRIAGRPLLSGASVTIAPGHRVGLVGPNGTGKTTLLRAILGEQPIDTGVIEMPPRWRVGTVAQEAPSGAVTLLDVVLSADTERARLLDEAETAHDPGRIAEIHTRLADIGAHTAVARAASILSGLGFDEAAQGQPVGDLSGGMRMRVALAAVLFSAPDLLLLDEPTNHLDLEATMWLEGYLATYPHTIVIVSHDRDLLNRAVDMIVHLENQKLTAYSGGYDVFERTRRMRLEHQAAMAARQQAARDHMQAFVDRFRYKASKARQAQSRLKALAKMEPIVSVIEQHTPGFVFPKPEELSPPLIVLDRVSAGYGERVVLRNLDIRIDQDDRIALLGANGNGKSTLVKLLGGRLAPMAGEVRKSGKLKVGYFAQHQAEELDMGATALVEAQRRMPLATEEKVRNHLGRFGFGELRAKTRIEDLSGGEKARLLFALMAREAPHILLLDEPTNHLDIDSRQALVQAINEYDGAVVLISHDPHLVELTADRLLLVKDGVVRPFDGDIDDYRKLLVEQRRAERQSQRSAEPQDAATRRDQRRAAADARKALAPLRLAVHGAEQEIAKLETAKAKVEAQLANPKLYEGPAEKVTALQKQLHEAATKLADAEERWMAAQEALEAAQIDA